MRGKEDCAFACVIACVMPCHNSASAEKIPRCAVGDRSITDVFDEDWDWGGATSGNRHFKPSVRQNVFT
jgi:hypothetical protein